MSNRLHLFNALPIGSLFFRDPFNELENPSIKVDDTHARTPKGEVVEVNGGVLVFTGVPAIKLIPVALVHDDLIVEVVSYA